MSRYVLSFDYRSDNGPSLVGPFDSRAAAFAYAATIGGTLEYEAVPLVEPSANDIAQGVDDGSSPPDAPRQNPYRHMRLDTERAWCRVLLSSDNRAATTVRSEVGCAPCLAALDRAAAENAGVAP